MDRREEILAKVNILLDAYEKGLLGGEKMPEDENPHLDKGSKENYMYFTLPMALNYQRNSYMLWECANGMYHDKKAKAVFDSHKVCSMPEELLRNHLVEYKVAPDTHVIQASTRLGVISEEEALQGNVQMIVADRWRELLAGTKWSPIDVHTPMWLWSRGKFQNIF